MDIKLKGLVSVVKKTAAVALGGCPSPGSI
jgi:hypothetical protein